MKRGAIYARISRADKTVPKTENQIQICRDLAGDDGVTVDPRHIFIDDGIAASGREIDDTTLENRPDARRLLKAATAGEFDVLYAVEGERLARTIIDGVDFIKASKVGGVTWHFDTDGAINPATPSGEKAAIDIFTRGRAEGQVRTARQKRRYDRERAEGRPTWGTRAFGWEADRITVRESEARLIREAVEDVLNGGSITRVAHRWNELGVQTDGMQRPRKGRDGIERMPRPYWSTTTVRQLLLRDRNAGILTHRGKEMPNSQIEPIITREELRALKERVKGGTPVADRATSLVGGVAVCACGAPMHMTTSYTQRRGGPRYTREIYKCSQTGLDKTRAHTSIGVAALDAMMPDAVLNALIDLVGRGLDEAETPAEVAPLLAEKADLNERREQVQAVAYLPGADVAHAGRELARIDARVQTIDAEVDAAYRNRARKGALAAAAAHVRAWAESPKIATDLGVGISFVAPTPEAEEAARIIREQFLEHWESLTHGEKRDLIRATVRIVVTPASEVTVMSPRVKITPSHIADDLPAEPF